MENARQPASHAFGARHVSDIDRWVADVPTISVDVDEIHPAHDFDSGASTLSIRPSASSRRNFQAKPHPRCVIGFFACDIADRPDHHVPGVSGLADGDAILRTLVRLSVTRRNLLQWVTAAQAKHAVDLNLYGIFQRMAGGVLFALAAL